MTTYIFPPTDKTLYGLTTGTVYKPLESAPGLWDTGDLFITFDSLVEAEPDGVTDVRPFKVGDKVNTEEHLKALPRGTILRALYSGEAWQKVNDIGFLHIGSMKGYNAAAMSLRGAFTIVWLPETGEQA